MGTRAIESEPRLIIFFLQMPRPVAIPHGTVYTFQLPEVLEVLKGIPIAPTPEVPPRPNPEGNNWASFKFWQVKRTIGNYDALRPVLEAVVPKESLGLPSDQPAPTDEPRGYITIVEASTALRGLEDGDVSDAYDGCLAALQELFRAYGVSADHGMPIVSREMLPPIAEFITRTLFTQQWDPSLSAMFVNVNIPDEFLPELDEEGLARLARALSRLKVGYPLIPYREARLRARTALVEQGNYQDAVVHSETAVEILVDGILTLLLWEEGMSPTDAAENIFIKQLPWRLEQAMASRLGGDWKRDGTGPISRWDAQLAFLRGRVIHGGYRPTLQEARASVDIAIEIDEMIRVQLAGVAGTFPKTALLFLGKQGLERLNGWTRRVQDASNAADPTLWMNDYVAWRKALDAQRVNLLR
jgi:hypothetical protein